MARGSISSDDGSAPLLRDAAEHSSNSNLHFLRNLQSGALIQGYNRQRQRLQRFLSSRTQHYCVLALVSFDVLGIFADIFINLYECEEGDPSPKLDQIRSGLGIAGLVFSSVFMAELITSIWAFGWRYFTSWFHVFDGIVILAGFIVDVLLRGVLEEVASLVVILRLWRFFKIIEEFSVGAEEQMNGLEERIEALEAENQELKRELARNKGRKFGEEAGVGTYRHP
ncbi:MAG: hypothetical protein M1818_005114 [Claussenomyces sp. TS43310]|nr:MAG: hypothetical protein M1818_005114 [Claussenomyces sp. TS43310]